MSSLVSDIRDLRHHVVADASLDGEVPLLVVRGLERGGQRTRKTLSHHRKQTLRTARRIEKSCREGIGIQIRWMNGVHRVHPGGCGLKGCAVELSGRASIRNTIKQAVSG